MSRPLFTSHVRPRVLAILSNYETQARDYSEGKGAGFKMPKEQQVMQAAIADALATLAVIVETGSVPS